MNDMRGTELILEILVTQLNIDIYSKSYTRKILEYFLFLSKSENV